MRWFIFGVALIVAAVAVKMLPRYEIYPDGAPGSALEMDKWNGAVRVCTGSNCTSWIGGSGPAS